MRSSVSPNLLLIHLVYFLFLLVYSSALSHSFSVFSSSLLKFSLYSPILFLLSVVTFITIALNCLSGKLSLLQIRVFFSPGFYLVLSFDIYSFVFSFCLTFSVFYIYEIG